MPRGHCFLTKHTLRLAHTAIRQQHDKLYKTGDIAYVHAANGLLYLAGRRDDLVNIHGQKVLLEELDSIAAALGIARCRTIIVRSEAPRPDRLVLFFVATGEGKNMSAQQVKERLDSALRDTLPDYAVPLVLPYKGQKATFPRLPSGKVDRKALVAHYRTLGDVELLDVAKKSRCLPWITCRTA